MTQPKYSVFYGIKELHRLHAASSLAFDTETLQLQPEKGKLRLLQLGSYTLRTIVVKDSLLMVLDFGLLITQFLILAGYKNMILMSVERSDVVC